VVSEFPVGLNIYMIVSDIELAQSYALTLV